MRTFLATLVLALSFAVCGIAQAELPVDNGVYGIGAAKVTDSTSSFYDGQYSVSYQLFSVDDPKIEHVVLFRLNPKEPTPYIVQRLNELAATLPGFELDLTIRCKKRISNPSRPFYDMVRMGCEVLSVGHRRPRP